MKPIRTWVACLLLIVSSSVWAAGGQALKPLRLGMLPSLSLQKLFMRFKPLQAYLEKALHRKVILVTAVNYATYMKRASEYEYDLYFAAPHMAALAEADSGYRRVSMFTRNLGGYLVVRRDGPIKKISDLKGHIVAAPEQLAIITMMGEALLEQHHLKPGLNVKMEYTSTHNNAILALYTGNADAAVVSTGVYDIVAPAIRAKLKVLAMTTNVSHLMFMASPKLPEQEFHNLKQAMLRFTADGPGKIFFKGAPYGNMTQIRDADMENMQPYIKKLKQRLGWAK